MQMAKNESAAGSTFAGFERPDATFIMCPNEFLDLIVPNHSRGCVRLVAHVLYETLRWLKEDGTPNRQEISIPFNELIHKAGISRGAASRVKREAEHGNFIEVTKRGVAHRSGSSGQAAVVCLKWSHDSQPAKTPDKFTGFFSGVGHFTAMPHSYFSRIIRNESLATIKFVSVIFRNTVGYQTQFGRRKSIPLSFHNLHRLTNIKSPTALSKTIKHCLKSNYIELLEAGVWRPGKLTSKAAVYGPKYSDSPQLQLQQEHIDRFKKCSHKLSNTDGTKRFKNCSRGSSKTVADQQFKKCSPIKNLENKTQTNSVDEKSIQMLMAAGFTESSATKLSSQAERGVIEKQIEWIRYRRSRKNHLGYLRTAILEDWDLPPEAKVKQKMKQLRAKEQAHRNIEQTDEETKKVVSRHKSKLCEIWYSLSTKERQQIKQKAIALEPASCRPYLQKKTATDRPASQFLNEVARRHKLPTISEFETTVHNSQIG